MTVIEKSLAAPVRNRSAMHFVRYALVLERFHFTGRIVQREWQPFWAG